MTSACEIRPTKELVIRKHKAGDWAIGSYYSREKLVDFNWLIRLF